MSNMFEAKDVQFKIHEKLCQTSLIWWVNLPTFNWNNQPLSNLVKHYKAKHPSPCGGGKYWKQVGPWDQVWIGEN